MTKLYTLIASAALALGAPTMSWADDATATYDGYVTIDMGTGDITDGGQPTTINITYTGDTTCNFLLPDFELTGLGTLGDIAVDGVTVTKAANGTDHYAGSVSGMGLLDGAIKADVNLQGLITAGGVCDFDIDVIWHMDEESDMPIAVKFTSYKPADPAVTTISGYVTIDMGTGDITDGGQPTTIEISRVPGAPVCNFLLPDFELTGLGKLGDIAVDGVEVYPTGNGSESYTGSVKNMGLLDGAITADVNLKGITTAAGAADFDIDVIWHMDEESDMPIAVKFTSYKPADPIVTTISGFVTIDMGTGDITDGGQEATIEISRVPGAPVCDFLLPDFELSGLGKLGDIAVDGVEVTTDAGGNDSYTGSVKNMSLLDGAITADVNLKGTTTTAGAADFDIDVIWHVDDQTDMPIAVKFTTDKPGSVGSIGVDNDTPVIYYDLNGRRVDAATISSGIYIARQGGLSSKVLVK